MRRVLEAIAGAAKAETDVVRSQRAADRDSLTVLLRQFQTLKRSLQSRIMGQITDFRRFSLQAVLSDVDRLIAETEAAIQTAVGKDLQAASDRGAAVVDEPAKAVGAIIAPALPGVDTDLVQASFGNAVDLLSVPMKQFGAEVKAGVRRVTMAGDSRFEEIQRLRDKISGAGFDAAQYKAERIIRTEIGRVFNGAQFARMESLADTFPFLRKGWRATKDGRTRLGHKQAGADYARGQGIKIAEKFTVRVYDERPGKGAKLIGTAHLRFPLDPMTTPAGKIAAGATILCRCNGFTDMNQAELNLHNAARVSTALGRAPVGDPLPIPQPTPPSAPLPQPPAPKRVKIPKTPKPRPLGDIVRQTPPAPVAGTSTGVFKPFKSGAAAESALAKSAAQWSEGPPEDYFSNKAIKGYAGTSDSFAINQALREGLRNAQMREKALSLAKVLSNTAFPADVEAYRAINAKTATEQAQILASFTKQIGGTITDKAFVSTTANKKYAETWGKAEHGIKVTVLVPKGAKAAYLPKTHVQKQEWEILIQRGSRFVVKSVTGNQVVLELLTP